MSLDISPLISTLPSLLRDPRFSVDRNSFVTEAGNTEREREEKESARACIVGGARVYGPRDRMCTLVFRRSCVLLRDISIGLSREREGFRVGDPLVFR